MASSRHHHKKQRNNSSYSLITDKHTPGGIKGLLWAALAELFCTAGFVFLSTSAVTSGCHTTDVARSSGASNTTLAEVRPGACFLGSTNIIIIALAFGMSLFVMVYAAASFSGGHLNPAITLAMLATGRVSLLRAELYIVAQLAGAMLGSALNMGIDPQGFRAALGAVNQLNDWVGRANAFGIEALLTALFVFTVFAATDDKRADMKMHLPTLAPLAIGFVVFLCHVVAVPIDGCSVNPARSFGTAVTSGVWTDHWIFWVGPIGGGVIAGLAYGLLADRSLPAAERRKAKGERLHRDQVGASLPVSVRPVEVMSPHRDAMHSHGHMASSPLGMLES